MPLGSFSVVLYNCRYNNKPFLSNLVKINLPFINLYRASHWNEILCRSGIPVNSIQQQFPCLQFSPAGSFSSARGQQYFSTAGHMGSSVIWCLLAPRMPLVASRSTATASSILRIVCISLHSDHTPRFINIHQLITSFLQPRNDDRWHYINRPTILNIIDFVLSFLWQTIISHFFN